MIQDTVIRALFLRHFRPLCLYALHYIQDADAAEDIVQEAFTAFWQKADGELPEHPKSYLYTMVRNRCLDAQRRAGREPQRVQAEEAAAVADETVSEERAEREARLWAAMERLPARRRELLLMSKRDGMSYEEIAEATQLSLNTVRNQIHRALQTLRLLLRAQLPNRLDSYLLLF